MPGSDESPASSEDGCLTSTVGSRKRTATVSSLREGNHTDDSDDDVQVLPAREVLTRVCEGYYVSSPPSPEPPEAEDPYRNTRTIHPRLLHISRDEWDWSKRDLEEDRVQMMRQVKDERAQMKKKLEEERAQMKKELEEKLEEERVQMKNELESKQMSLDLKNRQLEEEKKRFIEKQEISVGRQDEDNLSVLETKMQHLEKLRCAFDGRCAQAAAAVMRADEKYCGIRDQVTDAVSKVGDLSLQWARLQDVVARSVIRVDHCSPSQPVAINSGEDPLITSMENLETLRARMDGFWKDFSLEMNRKEAEMKTLQETIRSVEARRAEAALLSSGSGTPSDGVKVEDDALRSSGSGTHSDGEQVEDDL